MLHKLRSDHPCHTCLFVCSCVSLCVYYCVVWELYTGQAAFRKLHVGQFFEAIVVRNLRPMIPRGMAADYQLLMQSCWSASPTDRCVANVLGWGDTEAFR